MMDCIYRQQGEILTSIKKKKKKSIYILLMSIELAKISQIGPEVWNEELSFEDEQYEFCCNFSSNPQTCFLYVMKTLET